MTVAALGIGFYLVIVKRLTKSTYHFDTKCKLLLKSQVQFSPKKIMHRLELLKSGHQVVIKGFCAIHMGHKD